MSCEACSNLGDYCSECRVLMREEERMENERWQEVLRVEIREKKHRDNYECPSEPHKAPREVFR